jgi:hypothetical protein
MPKKNPHWTKGLPAAQEIKPTSIYLPAGLHARLRTAAFAEGRKMNELVISGIEMYLRKGEKQP